MHRYGTLEFRRFHGTLDAALITRWAHFCVAFVDCFSSEPWPLLDSPSVEAALRELQAAQEAATPAELMARMGGRADCPWESRTADYLMRDALGAGAADDCKAL